MEAWKRDKGFVSNAQNTSFMTDYDFCENMDIQEWHQIIPKDGNYLANGFVP